MTGTSNAITTKVKSPPRLAMKSGDPSQYVCVNGEYIKGTHKRICLMQTQGTPFAAEISSYKQASGNTAASLQSGTSFIPSVQDTNAALAKKAEHQTTGIEQCGSNGELSCFLFPTAARDTFDPKIARTKAVNYQKESKILAQAGV